MKDFKNKPSLNLHGRTWDADHLGKFLNSDWGQKLFSVPKKVTSMESPSFFQASATFKAVTRDTPAPASFIYAKGHINDEDSPHELTSDLFSVANRMRSLENRMQTDEAMSHNMITPRKRRLLQDSNKVMRQQYNKLKGERLNNIKKERVFRNWYERFPKKVVSNETRAHVLEKYRHSSSDIYTGYKEQLGKTGLKVVNEHHDSFRALFNPTEFKVNTDRTQRLKELWGSERNVITGTVVGS